MIQFARQATGDTSVGGVQIAVGEMVVLWYPSANRDERQFADPYWFDIAPDPNRHLAFGHGPHVCVGANVARWELRAVCREFAARLPSLQVAGAAESSTDLHVATVHHLAVRGAPPVTAAHPARPLIGPDPASWGRVGDVVSARVWRRLSSGR